MVYQIHPLYLLKIDWNFLRTIGIFLEATLPQTIYLFSYRLIEKKLFIIREVNSDMPIYILNRTNAGKKSDAPSGI